MKRKHVIALAMTAVLVALLALGYRFWASSYNLPEATGPTITSSVGPNKTMPATRAGTNRCAELDKKLSQLLTDTPEGKAFTTRYSQIRDKQSNESGEFENASKEWVSFLAILPSHYSEFEQLAASDDYAKEAVKNVKTVVEKQPKMLTGKIPEFNNPEKSQRELAEGKQPTQNPEYVRTANQVDKALDQITWCMPTWPLLLG